jgi:phospholipase D1/2
MHQALLSAQNQVYIADWWLSPEFYLQRPVGTESTSLKNRESRLDLVLKNIADRGVQVLIIVYNEPTLALNNDSLHTKTHLESLSTNIKVHRHPNQPFFWSHHEKMVVID